MTSTYSFSPAYEDPRDRVHETRNTAATPEAQQHILPPNPAEANNSLSPFSSQYHSNVGSPNIHTGAHTPADSLSVQYPGSDYGEVDGDPFFGANFNDFEGAPLFLDDAVDQQVSSSPPFQPVETKNEPRATVYPLSPDKTPSLNHPSPESEKKSRNGGGGGPYFADPLPQSISPKQLTKSPPPPALFALRAPPELTTPDTLDSGSGSGASGSRSSEDGLAPAHLVMQNSTSPRVTVSDWGRDNKAPTTARMLATDDESPTTVRGAVNSDTLFTTATTPDALGLSAPRDAQGQWIADEVTGLRGLGPDDRPSTEVPSIKELEKNRITEERNGDVAHWISRMSLQDPTQIGAPSRPNDGEDNVPTREIEPGHNTVNKRLNGQIYLLGQGGEITREDWELMAESRVWNDAPAMPDITTEDDVTVQPRTANEAIIKYNKMFQDNESVISRAATWGTRRRSLPSIYDTEGTVSYDQEGSVGGNFLKKLSISRGDTSRPSPLGLGRLRGLMRKTSSQQLKRKDSSPDGAAADEEYGSGQNLAPPTRQQSWGKQKPTPSINTALISIGTSGAAVGAAHHARSGSISANPVTSPKSPFTNTLKTLRRPRSRSDLIKKENSEPSTLADMWKASGGPPVPTLTKSSAPVSAGGAGGGMDDEDDEDDDDYEDSDMKEASKMIEDITPTFAGFQAHILKLNPLLATANNYLVDRIGHQQTVRYKALLNLKLKHLHQVRERSCNCGNMCIELGGQATILNNQSEPRGVDPLSAGSDDDGGPLEGGITAESFPQDIPMPPTSALPAEFECQLCFQCKKFQKPSDWTKHVHEDVQPFTCTWDRCRDPKIFKRKADWVRHENEGHRHLEWWTCDVEDCRHICYRRDNFLQHLVREHKFAEPKHKTKAAIKRAGGNDPTWQKVEKCHTETPHRPQEEPCRFCGKTFPTWKKLTVHLAKHMEQISLPIIRLAKAKDLEPDTIISPVQDPPPRVFNPLPQQQQHDPSVSLGGYGMGMTAMTMGDGGLSYAQAMVGPYDFSSNPAYTAHHPAHHQGAGPAYYHHHQPQFGSLGELVDHHQVDMSSFVPVTRASGPSPLYHHQAVAPQLQAPQPPAHMHAQPAYHHPQQQQQQQQQHPHHQQHHHRHSHGSIPVVSSASSPFVAQVPVMGNASAGPAASAQFMSAMAPQVDAAYPLGGMAGMAGLQDPSAVGAGFDATGFQTAAGAGLVADPTMGGGPVGSASPNSAAVGAGGVVTPHQGSLSPYQQSPYSHPSHSPHQGGQYY